jgi:hypothetical protein
VLISVLLAVAGPAWAWDRGADGKFEKRSSAHFVLFQDVDIDQSGGFGGSRRFEQSVLDVLERAYDTLDQHLGLRPTRKIEVLIYDPNIFDREFAGAFRFRAAGFYHGVIRVRGDTQVHTGLVRVLNHELVHAALDAAAPSFLFPGWVNEGLAEWFEVRALGKRHLSAGERAALTKIRGQGGLLPLSALSAPSFGRFAPGAAQLAYLQSYGMVEFLVRHHGPRKLREFCQSLLRTRDLQRSLKRVYRMDLRDLETRFVAELG